RDPELCEDWSREMLVRSLNNIRKEPGQSDLNFDLYFSVQSRTLAYLSARGLYQKDHRIQSIDSSWVISRFFFTILSPSTCLVRRSCPDVGRVNPLSVF